MAVDPKRVCLFVPPELKKFKLNLFNRIADHIVRLGGRPPVRGSVDELRRLSDDVIPIVGCTPSLRPLIEEWIVREREWIYWDRGYARRVFATWLPRGENGGYYRWHVGHFQMRDIMDVPSDRWGSLDIETRPWNKSGRNVVVADTGPEYWDLHGDRNWARRTMEQLRSLTDRPIVLREKKRSEDEKRDLWDDVRDAHCLVTHGSIAAVESVIMGCPVFVHESSAAALVGETDFSKIESPLYPNRTQWLNSLAYCQFSEQELVDGTLWRLMT